MHHAISPRCAAWGLALTIAVAGATAPADDPAGLAVDQAALAAQFEQLEALAMRIAELLDDQDPARAEQLRAAVRSSREQAVAARFRTIVTLLEQERLEAARRDQQTLADRLGELMTILLADPSEARAAAERERAEAMLKDVKRFIKQQRGLRNDLLDDRDPASLSDRQRELADQVERALEASQQGKGDGQPKPSDKPSEQPPSGDAETPAGPSLEEPPSPIKRSRQRLDEAKQAMQQAAEDLQREEAEAAEADQIMAQQRLDDARREIEERLRQLREEEDVRRLTRLATRFRRMLAEQTDVYEQTKAARAAAASPIDRATKLAAVALSQREQNLVQMAEGALRLLKEDGKSIAFPATVKQIREDMNQAALWLADTDLGAATQQTQQDIIEQLSTAIATFETAAAEKKEQASAPKDGQTQAAGDPQLVDLLAELRMVRSLQGRLLRRTTMWQSFVDEGKATEQQANRALRQLAEDQDRLSEATAQIGEAIESR